MLSKPVIKYREEEYYAAIEKRVSRKDIPAVLPPLIPEVHGWLAKNKIPCAGAPFFRYLSTDNTEDFLVAVGVPVDKPVMGDDRITAGSLPAGNYLSIIYTGDYTKVMEAHMAMQEWVKEKELKVKPQATKEGKLYSTVTEFYLTDPKKEPSPDKWETEVLVLLDQ